MSNKKIIEIICLRCLKPFQRMSNNQKYCPICKDAAYGKKLKEWWDKNSFRISKLNKIKRKAHLDKIKKKERERRQKHKYRISVVNKAGWATRSKKIKKLPCVICDNVKSEAHHWDYTKPLKVSWLCRRHHQIIHTILPKLKEEI